MASRSLDPVLAKIESSASTQNLYKNLNREDRVTLQATPLSNNFTGSAQGLMRLLTPVQLQAVDVGRDTYMTLVQYQECQARCVPDCETLLPHLRPACVDQCLRECDNTRLDFI